MVIFPFYLFLARWSEDHPARLAWQTISAMLAGLFMALFARWYWVG